MAVDPGSQTLPVPALPPSGAAGKLVSQGRTITLVAMLGLAEAFFWLLGLNGSTLLGGAWACWNNTFLFYIVLLIMTVVIAGSLSATPLTQPGSSWQFLRWFGVMGAITWVIVSLAVHYGILAISSESAGLCGNQISQFVWVVVFVAPVEEFLFRVVLPPRVGWVVSSLVLFPLFHVSVYLAVLGPGQLFNGFLFAGILGFLLWETYDWRYRTTTRYHKKGDRVAGYGGAVGFHAFYDLTILGIIGVIGSTGSAIPLWLAHL